MGDGYHHHAVLAGIQSSSSSSSGGPFLRAAQGKLAKSFQAKASPLESAAREQRIAASIVIGGVVSKAPTARVDHRPGQHGNTRSFPGSGLSDVFYSLSFFFSLFEQRAPGSDFLSYRLAVGVGQKLSRSPAADQRLAAKMRKKNAATSNGTARTERLKALIGPKVLSDGIASLGDAQGIVLRVGLP